MIAQHSVVFAEPTRTAIATSGGSLKNLPAVELGIVTIPAALAYPAGSRARWAGPSASTPHLDRSGEACLDQREPGYMRHIEIGDVMRGGEIARVIDSRADWFSPGEIMQTNLGWQSHLTPPVAEIEKLDPELGGPLDWIGLTGSTTYFAMRENCCGTAR
jgi:hypothetical protein